MIKHYYVRTSKLKEGMRIDQSVIDRMDRTLIVRGSILDAYTIEALHNRGIRGVYISEGEEDVEPEKTGEISRKRIKNKEKSDI